MEDTQQLENGIKEHSITELEKLFQESMAMDRSIFTEMRTNVLLVSGEHYSRQHSKFIEQMRSYKSITDSQKIRLTKNHTGCIARRIQTNILAAAPGISFKPHNESELQDQKTAELDEAVWKFIRERNDFEDLDDEFSDDFHITGEVWGEVYWDESDGDVLKDEQGSPIIDGITGRPVMSGMVKVRNIPAYNVLRDTNARKLKDSKWFIVQEMVSTEVLKEMFPEYKDKITSSADENVSVFDATKADYRPANNETFTKKYYFRKCARYPNGYFYIVANGIKLAKGEFPDGKFPLVGQYYQRVSGTARGISWIRDGRPYQVEINRASSKIAEHQITLGDDKLLTNDGSDMSEGIGVPGIRRINFAGEKPTILKGSTGQQYIPYLEQNIKEYYEAMGVMEQPDTGQIDLMPTLFKSAKQRSKFKNIVGRYERFKKGIALLAMDYARMYFPDELTIKAISRNEIVNISEFKAHDNTSSRVVAEPTSEDIESRFGRQMMIKDFLQYAGGKLEAEQLALIARNAPFGNLEGAARDLTLNYDRANNLILALDRGEDPAPFKYEDHKYVLKRLQTRVTQADFSTLDVEIQQKYYNKIVEFENMEAEALNAIQRAQSGFIPVDGFLVTVQLRIPDPKDPTKMRLVRLPYGSIEWLVKKLESQGYAQDALAALGQGVQKDIANMISGQGESSQAPLQTEVNQLNSQSQPMVNGVINNGY